MSHTDTVIREFLKITEIPRPSHHEEKIAAYLCAWAKEHGLSAERDEIGSVIMEKPAAAGCEAMPMVILQAHMDMVCAAAEGVKYDPLNDSIRVIREGTVLRADGTTLGADDGMGIAMALTVLQDDTLRHGPIRAIFTPSEEDDMASKEMNPKYFGGKYLINLDWEKTGTLCNACAGSITWEMSHRSDWESAPRASRTMTISLSGLQGGHSGIDIHRRRANALVTLAAAMTHLRRGGVSFRIADFSGGDTPNAIPDHAHVVFAVEEGEMDQAMALVEDFSIAFKKAYGHTETAYSLEVGVEEQAPARVLRRETGYALVNLLMMVPYGIHTMSATAEGLVESSANMGMLRVGEKEISAICLLRSSAVYQATYLSHACRTAAEVCGFEARNEGTTPMWEPRQESHLTKVACGVYEAQNGKPMTVMPVHAGLECGGFVPKNPALDMISIGPTLKGVHTPEECCDTEDVRITLALLCGILETLSK